MSGELHRAVDDLIDRWQAAWVGRDGAAFTALCAPDIHYEDPLCGEPLESPDALAEHAARLWAAFPDARIERTGERLSDGRFIAAPFKLLGTHRGEIMGVPPTGREVVLAGINIFRVQDGKLVERWSRTDDLGLLQQLGIVPAMAS